MTSIYFKAVQAKSKLVQARIIAVQGSWQMLRDAFPSRASITRTIRSKISNRFFRSPAHCNVSHKHLYTYSLRSPVLESRVTHITNSIKISIDNINTVIKTTIYGVTYSIFTSITGSIIQIVILALTLTITRIYSRLPLP